MPTDPRIRLEIRTDERRPAGQAGIGNRRVMLSSSRGRSAADMLSRVHSRRSVGSNELVVEENSMIFANYVTYGDRAKILKLRPTHQKYLFGLRDRGLVVAAGSFPEDVGGLFLYETDTLESAEQLKAGDPYVLGGAIAHYKITPWEIHAVNPALLRLTHFAADS